ncbi:MAG TPA: hypothetical protein VJ724_04605 [Tahibacter sp.]|nr:hypothetical protein [Tahibacter sp.]
MNVICKLLFLALAATAPATAAAADKAKEKPFVADTKAAFAERAAGVREQMDRGGRFEFVSDAERAKVEARLNDMAALFEHGDVATLSKAQIADLYVAQEDINAILTKRDGRRVICERVKIVGSNLKSLQCLTYAEKERGRRVSQDALRNTMRPANYRTGNDR